MNNPLLTKSFLSGAAITKYRIVKFGADDDHVIQATAVTENLIGVAAELDAGAAEQRLDVVMDGVAELEYGGTITRGDPVTTDATGKALAAAPAAAVNNGIIGYAMVSGIVGDIGSVHIKPGRIQG